MKNKHYILFYTYKTSYDTYEIRMFYEICNKKKDIINKFLNFIDTCSMSGDGKSTMTYLKNKNNSMLEYSDTLYYWVEKVKSANFTKYRTKTIHDVDIE